MLEIRAQQQSSSSSSAHPSSSSSPTSSFTIAEYLQRPGIAVTKTSVVDGQIILK